MEPGDRKSMIRPPRARRSLLPHYLRNAAPLHGRFGWSFCFVSFSVPEPAGDAKGKASAPVR
jgi:hypothetical protein